LLTLLPTVPLKVSLRVSLYMSLQKRR
jgi:hypothetical protein